MAPVKHYGKLRQSKKCGHICKLYTNSKMKQVYSLQALNYKIMDKQPVGKFVSLSQNKLEDFLTSG